MLEYYIEPMNIPGMENVYCGYVQPYGSVDQNHLVNYATTELGTTITKADMLGSLQVYWQSIRHFLLLGFRVVTDMFCIRLIIKNRFTGYDDKFDKNRHRVRFFFIPGKNFDTILPSDFQFTKVQHYDKSPKIDEVFDFRTKLVNKILTPGDEARISGSELNFSSDDIDSGIFLIPEILPLVGVQINNPAATQIEPPQKKPTLLVQNKTVKVSNDDIHSLTEGQILFRIPDLHPGKYTIDVRKKYGKDLLRTERKEGFTVEKINKTEDLTKENSTVVPIKTRKKKSKS